MEPYVIVLSSVTGFFGGWWLVRKTNSAKRRYEDLLSAKERQLKATEALYEDRLAAKEIEIVQLRTRLEGAFKAKVAASLHMAKADEELEVVITLPVTAFDSHASKSPNEIIIMEKCKVRSVIKAMGLLDVFGTTTLTNIRGLYEYEWVLGIRPLAYGSAAHSS